MKIYLSVFFVLVCHVYSLAQVTIIVDKLPLHTPDQDPIYLVGSFNDWNPGEERFKLAVNEEGKHFIVLPKNLTAFEYKFTRGGWNKVEGTWDGKPVSNRVYIAKKSNPAPIIHVKIDSWEDLASQVTLIVSDIPEDTSPYDPIYLTGSFNGWAITDSALLLNREKGGMYSITLPAHLDSFYYKFTRGTWESVECLPNGKYKPNRLYVKKSREPETIRIVVEAWEDYQKYQLSAFEVIIILLIGFCLFQGFLYLGEIIQKNDKQLSLMLIWGTGLTLFLKLLADLNILKKFAPWWEPYTLLMPLIIMIILIVVFDQSLGMKWRFRPLILLMMFALGIVYWNVRKMYIEGDVIVEWLERDLTVDNLILKVWTTTGIYLTIYWAYQNLHQIRCEQKHSMLILLKQREKAFRDMSKILAFVAITSTISVIIQFVRIIFFEDDYRVQDISDYIYWTNWILWTVILAFWLYQYHEIVRPLSLIPVIEEAEPTEKKEILNYKEKINDLMLHQKVYEDPELTLNDMAGKLDIPAHRLSKIIHKAYDRTFPELVNDYRTQAFIQKVYSGSAEKNTLLAIALDVGFKSKSTFNRAFKKSTNKTPSEYFSEHKSSINNDKW